MKNQYFGDINDYRKYGLLRILCGGHELRLGVCWMLTQDDDKADGRKIKYLDKPEKWEHLDPKLFSVLAHHVKEKRERSVQVVQREKLLPRAEFFKDDLVGSEESRRGYFQRLRKRLSRTDLIFFDPDNGMEVKSVPLGRKDSNKYLYWHELVNVYTGGHSILVYQHFPREKREPFIERMKEQVHSQTRARAVIAFRTANVVLFLISHSQHKEVFDRQVLQIQDKWEGQINVC